MTLVGNHDDKIDRFKVTGQKVKQLVMITSNSAIHAHNIQNVFTECQKRPRKPLQQIPIGVHCKKGIINDYHATESPF